jgi:hypothetical protein
MEGVCVNGSELLLSRTLICPWNSLCALRNMLHCMIYSLNLFLYLFCFDFQKING